jgi:hypothetical protein
MDNVEKLIRDQFGIGEDIELFRWLEQNRFDEPFRKNAWDKVWLF